MGRKAKGYRRKTRYLLKRKPRQRGKTGLRKVLREYDIDEKVVNIGGKYVIKVYDERAWGNDHLQNVMLLFTMVLKFLDPIKNKLKRTRKKLRSGEIALDISAQEEKLYRNPRALKR